MAIVEDEVIVCKLLERAFSKDYEIHIHESAEAFQQQFDASVPHVLLTDKNLPGITGIELVEKHRQVTSDFEAVLITGYADIDSVILSMDLGIFSYMRKPFEIQELKHTVANAQARLARRMQRRDALEQVQGLLEEYIQQLENTARKQPGAPDPSLTKLAQGFQSIQASIAQITAELRLGPKPE